MGKDSGTQKDGNRKSRNRSEKRINSGDVKFTQEESTIQLAKIQSLPGRKGDFYCADCHARDPRWVAWNLGIFICIRCSGIHRSIGTHFSKVKSTNMDRWTEHQLNCMRNGGGNDAVNTDYEANLPSVFSRPQTDYDAEVFIRDKYIEKKYHISRNRMTSPKSTSQSPLLENNIEDVQSDMSDTFIYSKLQLQQRAQLATSEFTTNSTQQSTLDKSLWK
eukprot:CFRG3875T1